jgi:hypothetical protein
MNEMFLSQGTLVYSLDPIKLIVQVDPDISHFARSLIPKYLHVKQPMFAPHISVVRDWTPPNMDVWEKYQGHSVNFEYDSYVHNDELYYWLDVYSLELEAVRTELGLRPHGDVTTSPDGKHRFHITVGNLKK